MGLDRPGLVVNLVSPLSLLGALASEADRNVPKLPWWELGLGIQGLLVSILLMC